MCNEESALQNVNFCIVILGQLRALCSLGVLTTGANKVPGERQRSRTTLRARNFVVCEKTFCFLHGFSTYRFERLKRRYLMHGLSEVLHRNVGRVPHNAVNVDRVRSVVLFLCNYAQQNAIFLPGRQANQFNPSVKLLPTSCTKKSVHEVYEECCREEEPVSLWYFRTVWKTFCPEIVIMKPKSDLCQTCYKNYTSLGQQTGLNEAEKRRILNTMQEHLNKVDEERKYYRDTIAVTKAACDGITSPMCHYSFDMAQQVALPHDPLQPGPLYFLVPFKIAIFGVMNDTISKQHNYLIPESARTIKGANFIISILHYHFRKHSLRERILKLHADNCTWQNKNNILLSYLCLRILCGWNDEIELSFMPVGHTKFSCDWAFGLFKILFRRFQAFLLDHILDIFRKSSRVNIGVKVADEAGNLCFPFYDWQDFFKRLSWKTIPLITQYSHFNLYKEHPGLVYCRQRLSDEPTIVEIGLLPENFYNTENVDDPETESDPIAVNEILVSNVADEYVLKEAVGPQMTTARRQYFYDKIRKYCNNESKDILCPQPEQNADLMEEQPKEKNKRGRPTKPKATDAAPTTSAVKRSRGRPSKQMTTDVTPTEVAVKKPRGRPPKRIATDITPTEVAVKKQRGRPPKQIATDVTPTEVAVKNQHGHPTKQ